MWIRRLTLSHFRNYRALQLDLPQGLILVLGDNAQGKSNLLEAVFLLATTKSDRVQTDGGLIHWEALDELQPVARVAAEIERSDGPLELEIAIAGRPKPGDRSRVPASKRSRVNGVAKRQADVVGQLMAVLFTTADMELISGSPSGRRRYLDVMLSQIDPAYAQALQQYGKVVTQRNALLKRIQAGEAGKGELDFWDEELSGHGATLFAQRASSVESLAALAAKAHYELSGGLEELTLVYVPRLEGWDAVRCRTQASGLDAAMQNAFSSNRPRDIGAGMTLTGPHRDDVAIELDGTSASEFASRGQQRTAALALRLAEARFMADQRGELPVVLLDDVLSELDKERRHAVLASLGEWDQLIITSTDADRFNEDLTPSAVFRVSAGIIEPA
ncbi:MAG: DNA replication/repair protein RecF [Chloroflexi bacterium]|nr:DNA replication/repair protein RecF [Chloroflexota bacterium]